MSVRGARSIVAGASKSASPAPSWSPACWPPPWGSPSSATGRRPATTTTRRRQVLPHRGPGGGHQHHGGSAGERRRRERSRPGDRRLRGGADRGLQGQAEVDLGAVERSRRGVPATGAASRRVLRRPDLGTFDYATYSAVKQLQNDKDLFVDGVVGRETAMALGIWPDESIVRRPHPAAGARRQGLAGLSRCRRWPPSAKTPRRCRRTPAAADGSCTRAPASGCGPSTRTTRSSGPGWCRAASTTTRQPGVHQVYSRSRGVHGVERQGVPAA